MKKFFTPKIFKSNELQTEFEGKGYCVLNLASQNKTETIKQFLNNHVGDESQFGYRGEKVFEKTSQLRVISKFLKETLVEELNTVFENVNIFSGTFLIKPNNPDSFLHLHQDWTNVEEENNVSFGVWLALDDVNENNGGLFFIPGSHKVESTVRPNNHYPWPFEEHKTQLLSFKENVSCKKGQCIVLNHRVLHGSNLNNGNKPRLAAVLAGINKNAQLIHYYVNQQNKNNEYTLSKYHITEQDFADIIENKKPQTEPAEILLNYKFKQFEFSRLKKTISENF
jgi:hypothetical protein